mgnify:CR=1 FL=1
MAEVIEYKDRLGEYRVKVKAVNGNKTYASTEGYKNKKDAKDTAINASLDILETFARILSDTQRQRVSALCYLILDDE